MKHSQTTRLALALGAVLLVGYLVSSYSSSKGAVVDGMEKLADSLGVSGPLSDGAPQDTYSYYKGGNVAPSESVQSRKSAGQSMYTETHLGSDELLPKGGLGADWAAVNPASMGDMKGQNFLEAGYHTNTAVAGVSQTNRNATWDVRSEVPNPQAKVGPFLNTTIEPNPFKRGLTSCE
jgi:hypothetical protein